MMTTLWIQLLFIKANYFVFNSLIIINKYDAT